MDTKQILILIGFAIYYFLRANGNKDKKQKKVAPKRPQSNQKGSSRQKNLEEILRELAQQGETPIEKKKEAPKPAFEYEVPSIEEIEDKKVEEPKETKTTRISLEDDSHESMHFDLRQAVINDAILNRPWE
mgnify:CR=1 FL=1